MVVINTHPPPDPRQDLLLMTYLANVTQAQIALQGQLNNVL